MTAATAYSEAAEYPHCTLRGTLTCSSHGGTTLYDTHIAGQEESSCVDHNLPTDGDILAVELLDPEVIGDSVVNL